MKPKNFPARKLLRQLKAQGKDPKDYENELKQARLKRTKKDRSTKTF